MIKTLDENFWSDRYATQKTGWDVGIITPPLKNYIDQLENKDLNILIPGAGNSYEAEYLHQQGFRSVTVVDIAEAPLENFKKRCPDFPEHHLLHLDFFDLDGQYDLIFEQTFFCALVPDLRTQYVQQMKRLLQPGGKLVGVLFYNLFLDGNGPPFGATPQAYQSYFSPHFELKHFAECYNSIKPRQGAEWFINLQA